jgi:hypothetical protein
VIRFTSAARQQDYTCQIGPVSGLLDLEASMTALAIVIARVLFKESFETRTLKLLTLLCCAGLLASMLLIVYGVAFGSEFF